MTLSHIAKRLVPGAAATGAVMMAWLLGPAAARAQTVESVRILQQAANGARFTAGACGVVCTDGLQPIRSVLQVVRPQARARINYEGWPNSLWLSNGTIDVVATTDVGPRILYFGASGRPNVFWNNPATLGHIGGKNWEVYGGHRLWHGPEDPVRTYVPDNGRLISATVDGSSIRLVQAPEPGTHIQKEITIQLAPGRATARVVHRLTNTGSQTELAPWAISVMQPGGVALLPFPPAGSHEENLQAGRGLSLWAYTDMSDPRWQWGRDFVILRQDKNATTPQKVGMQNATWAAYVVNGQAFVKHFVHDPAGTYPDRGANVEAFTNEHMLELETLGPMTVLQPGQSVEHTEIWELVPAVSGMDTEMHAASLRDATHGAPWLPK